jgi:hypothetical protein
VKKTDTTLALHRETLQCLDEAPLKQSRGGIFTKQPTDPTPTGTCTFTCAGCL